MRLLLLPLHALHNLIKHSLFQHFAAHPDDEVRAVGDFEKYVVKGGGAGGVQILGAVALQALTIGKLGNIRNPFPGIVFPPI